MRLQRAAKAREEYSRETNTLSTEEDKAILDN